MKKFLNTEVVSHGVGTGIIAAIVFTLIVGAVAHADTIISTLISNTTNSALATPVFDLSGSWITGGSATTTKPHALIEPTGTISTSWSTDGTGLGINAASGFTGNLADLKLAGSSLFKVAASGTTSVSGTLDVSTDVTKNGTSILVPPGTMTMFAGATAPAGYLLCDGASYSTTTYASLFAVIGYTYGGSGSTFAMPDMRGRFAEGVSAGVSNISDKALGQAGGEETHTLSVDQLPPHNFMVNVPIGGSTVSTFSIFGGETILTLGSQDLTTNTIGSGQAFNVLSPYLSVNYIIKY